MFFYYHAQGLKLHSTLHVNQLSVRSCDIMRSTNLYQETETPFFKSAATNSVDFYRHIEHINALVTCILPKYFYKATLRTF